MSEMCVVDIIASVRATTQDQSFTFTIEEQHRQWLVTVWSHISHSFDVTGKQGESDPRRGPFVSLQDAKDWALVHAQHALAQRDTEVHWA